MMKSILAAGVSLLAFSAVTTAQAAPVVGHISGEASYVSYDSDVFSGKNIDSYKYNFNGAALFDLTPSWNIQFDSTFRSLTLSSDAFGGKSLAIDTWDAGTQVFWRDTSKGLFGVTLGYNSLDLPFGESLDGFYAGLRGEYFANDHLTVGGGFVYNMFDGKGQLSNYTGSLFGTYYVGTQTGISLRGQYASTDISGTGNSFETWGLSTDVEYLFQNNLSIAGSVGYEQADLPYGTANFDQWTVGAKLKVYFGTEGSLANQHRTGSLAPLPTVGLPFYAL